MSWPGITTGWSFANRLSSEVTLAASRCLDFSDVDLPHLHHRIERTRGDRGVRISDRLHQGDRSDLPGQWHYARRSITCAGRGRRAARSVVAARQWWPKRRNAADWKHDRGSVATLCARVRLYTC